jgi:hypothetical protein
MNESPSVHAQVAHTDPNTSTLVMAVVAPFGAIALLATPLFVDALRLALGL